MVSFKRNTTFKNFTFFVLFLFPIKIISQTSLSAGDIAIILNQSDNEDNFAFITFVDIDAGTGIYFTDCGADATGFDSTCSEGAFKYTVPAGGLSAGEIVKYDGNSSFAVYTDTRITGSFSLATSGDQIIAFQDSTNPAGGINAANNASFLFIIQNASTAFTGNKTDSNQSGLPSGLSDTGLPRTALGLGSGSGSQDEFDNTVYNGSYNFSTSDDYNDALLDAKISMTNPSNYTQQNSVTDAGYVSDLSAIPSSITFPPITWNGSINNNWHSADNWTPATVPGTGTDISIPSGLTNYPTASSAVTVNSVAMASGTSLIAQSTFSGNITYSRTLNTTNWYLISSPVSGQDIDAFVSAEGLASGTGNNLGFAPYTNNGSAWDYYQNGASGTGNFIAVKGYSVRLASTGDIAFTGTMLTSNQTISITDGSANEFNLVGNPYPSFIAVNNNADGTNNILKVNDTDNDFLSESTIWMWDQANSMYDQVNQASSAFYIAPGQGFFVSANETGAPHNFSITEAMQSHQSSDSFQKSTTNRTELQLIMTNGSLTRDVDIYYIDGTTTGFDNGFDSSIFGGTSNSFAVYTQVVANSQGRKLGIQSLPNSDLDNMIIPVGVNSNKGSVTFTLKTLNLPSGYKVFLEDRQTGNFIRLDEEGNKYEVSFTKTTSDIGRFFLHTTSNSLNTNNFSQNNISVYQSSKNNLRVVGVHQGNTSVGIFNILGKQVLNVSFKANGVNDLTLPYLKQGVYFIQINSIQGTTNKKIVIE